MRCKNCNTEIFQTRLWTGMDYAWRAVDNSSCTKRYHLPGAESDNVKNILKKYE